MIKVIFFIFFITGELCPLGCVNFCFYFQAVHSWKASEDKSSAYCCWRTDKLPDMWWKSILPGRKALYPSYTITHTNKLTIWYWNTQWWW